MQELIEKIQHEHGLTAQQVHGILNTVKDFVKEKFPMIGGAIDNVFPSEFSEQKGTDTDIAQAVAGSTTTGDEGTTEGPTSKGGSFLDPQSDIPGEEGEKEKQSAKERLNEMVNPENKK